ncbi:hypothetical protein GCM10009838_23800 [Catenulispora subtropica]|uniref:Uncharacterized protein n=1 Tax=Catenulispora subtropica TaxID=450798 RepID=A0ABP5CNX4_9ACTN
MLIEAAMKRLADPQIKAALKQAREQVKRANVTALRPAPVRRGRWMSEEPDAHVVWERTVKTKVPSAPHPTCFQTILRIRHDHHGVVAEHDHHSRPVMGGRISAGKAYRLVFIDQIERLHEHTAESMACPMAPDVLPLCSMVRENLTA